MAPRNDHRHRLKAIGLVSAMIALLATVLLFVLCIVQLQSAAAAYLGGQSVWTRSQMASVQHLDHYAQSGAPERLQRAREALTVPLSDRRARMAMEADTLDYPYIKQQLINGKNHPDDIPGMVVLYRYFSEVAPLRQAVDVWRASDEHILAIDELADQLESEWARPQPDRQQLQQWRQRLGEINSALTPQTEAFRQSMTAAARWLTSVLSYASAAFLTVTALIAWWLVYRLLQVLRRSQNKFRAIFEQAAVGMMQLDSEGRIRDVNPAITEIMRRPRKALLGVHQRELVHPEDWSFDEQRHLELQNGQIDNYTQELRLKQGTGGIIWARLTFSRAIGRSGAPYFIVIVEDVSESRRLSSELSYQATHDALTGLHNRRAFERRLAEALGRAHNHKTQHALCFIDLDQFKIVNDTSGHGAGDRLLQQVVECFRRNLRKGDMLARLGGDEFGMILEECDLDTAAAVAEKLRTALEQIHFAWSGRVYDISCSIGLVPINPTTPDTGFLLRAADIACYIAKEQGRNRVYLSREDDRQQAERRGEMEWLNRIRTAMAEKRLFLDAQMIVPIDDPQSTLCYEVLVRLLNEDGEIVPPGVFLPAAERFGAAYQVDRWVIEHTLEQLAAHPGHLRQLDSCHINLSGVTLNQSDCYDFIVGQLERYRIPPRKICFEVTETAAINNLVEAIHLMERLGDYGCRFALDDFGTGLSSFSYLRRLPVERLKIDGVFVRDIASDETDRAMVRAINEIGQTLGKTTIAEFVEDEATLKLLREIGVDYAQGFGIHKPCRFTDFLAGRMPERQGQLALFTPHNETL